MKGQKISIEIFLLNELPPEIIQKLTENPEHIYRIDSEIYYLYGQRVMKFHDDQYGNDLLYSIIQLPYLQSHNISRAADLYRQILTDSLPSSIRNSLGQYDIFNSKERCVIVFRTFLPQKKDLYSVFSTTIPIEKEDVVIPVRFDTVVLVKDIYQKTMDDINEYSSAVINTLEEEGYGCVKAGIGRKCNDIFLLRETYLEAQRAIELGIRYHSNEKIFCLSELTLETIIDSIPAERRKQIRSEFLQSSAESGISEELLETVRVFFQNDLNLTATAKKLFIHRNTLNYRLDKVQKLFSLDVRCFHDAVVFKIITDFPDNEMDQDLKGDLK